MDYMNTSKTRDSDPSIDTDPPSQELTALDCTGNRTRRSGVRETDYSATWEVTHGYISGDHFLRNASLRFGCSRCYKRLPKIASATHAKQTAGNRKSGRSKTYTFKYGPTAPAAALNRHITRTLAWPYRRLSGKILELIRDPRSERVVKPKAVLATEMSKGGTTTW